MCSRQFAAYGLSVGFGPSCGSFLSFFAFPEGMTDRQISALGGWPTVSGGFLRQVFITTRTLPFFSAENVALHLALEAGARDERRLEGVGCRRLFGAARGQRL